MPTKQELDDLCNKCEWIWTKINGVNGYVVRGRGDYISACIFLPCAGGSIGPSLSYVGSCGYYWSSVPYSDSINLSYSWYLKFFSYFNFTDNFYRRNFGQSVRPVQGFTK